MPGIKILQSAFAKSGNFWLYRILQEILQAGGFDLQSYIQNHPIHALAKTWKLSNASQADLDFIDITPHGCFFRISSIFKMPIDDLDGYLSQCSIVRTHSPYCSSSDRIFRHFNNVIYLIRDPRDVLVSFSRYVFTPYFIRYYPHSFSDSNQYINSNLEARMFKWVQHVSGHLSTIRQSSPEVIFYERIKGDFEGEVRKLARSLGIELSQSQVLEIEGNTSIQTMRSTNPGHVRSGKAGGWRNDLSVRQQRRATYCTAPLLTLLGYQTGRKPTESDQLPSYRADLTSSAFSRAARQCYLRIGLSAVLNHQISSTGLRRIFASSY